MGWLSDLFKDSRVDEVLTRLDTVESQLNYITTLIRRVLMDQTLLAQELTNIKNQLDKAKAEVMAKVADLEAALANAGQTTPEVDAALAALRGAAQAIDDLNPDTPTP